MMKAIKLFLFSLLLSSATQFAWSQNTSYRTDPVKATFSSNAASEIVIISPEEFVDNNGTRGFKKVVNVNDQIELVGTIADEDGISLVLINDKPVQLIDQGYFKVQIPVFEGLKEIEIQVLDKKNNSTKKVIAVNVKEPIGTGDYYALLIGVNEYDDPNIADLDKPIADAGRLGSVLESYYTFPKENITYLENPTRTAIIDALDQLSQKLTREDNLLIFYAGHGYWDVDRKIGYWIPSNGSKTSTADWFRNTTLTDQLRTINTKHTLLIADACFSGSIFKSRSVFIGEDAVAIKKLYALPSRKAMTSGTLTEVPDQSEFLKYLTKRLEANSMEYLPAAELFASLRISVINNSDVIPQYGTIQKAGDEGGDFIFIKKN